MPGRARHLLSNRARFGTAICRPHSRSRLLSATRGVMTYGHGQTEAIADSNLESFLPGSSLTAIAATSIG